MKRMKKLASLVLALVMAFAMAMPAMAANISITGGATGAVYGAYKILNADELTDGSGEFNYTLNEKYAGILKTVTGKTTEAEIVDYIDNLETAADVREFADAVYLEIDDASLDADYTTSTNEFTGVGQGYYLIAETTAGTQPDEISLVMLDTAGLEDIEIATKESTVKVDKEVLEVNDSTGDQSWGNSADYDIDDVVKFQIVGTVSGNYDNFLNYYYSFADTMSEGLTLNQDSLKVYVGGTEAADGTYNEDGTDVTSQFTITKADHSFTATCADLKKLTGVTITANTKIYVVYTATLNEDAVVGATGNRNDVTLTFENDPYNDDGGIPTTIVTDTNIVFTFKSIVNKVDDGGNALEGAGFTLYKWDAAADNWTAVSEEITGVTTFDFKGLDAGKYKLVETTVPSGYNQADDIEFTVKAVYDKTTVPHTLTDLQVLDNDGNAVTVFTIDIQGGTISTDVENIPGVVLPETGGMGTTLFYIIGAVLLLGSGVVLITRKRMNG